MPAAPPSTSRCPRANPSCGAVRPRGAHGEGPGRGRPAGLHRRPAGHRRPRSWMRRRPSPGPVDAPAGRPVTRPWRDRRPRRPRHRRCRPHHAPPIARHRPGRERADRIHQGPGARRPRPGRHPAAVALPQTFGSPVAWTQSGAEELIRVMTDAAPRVRTAREPAGHIHAALVEQNAQAPPYELGTRGHLRPGRVSRRAPQALPDPADPPSPPPPTRPPARDRSPQPTARTPPIAPPEREGRLDARGGNRTRGPRPHPSAAEPDGAGRRRGLDDVGEYGAEHFGGRVPGAPRARSADAFMFFSSQKNAFSRARQRRRARRRGAAPRV